MSDETYLERLKHLRASLAEVEQTAQVGLPADRAVEWLRALAETWQQADVPEARSELVHAIYERIVVAGREFVSARLTPAAYAPARTAEATSRVLWKSRTYDSTIPCSISAPEPKSTGHRCPSGCP